MAGVTNDTIFFVAWLTLHDREFVKSHGRRVTPDLFPRGPLQGLVALALDQDERFRKNTTGQVVDLALTNGFSPNFYGTSAEEMQRTYVDLNAFAVEDDARSRAVEACLSWIGLRRSGMTLDTALTALDRGDEEGVAEALREARADTAPEETVLNLEIDFAESLLPLEDNAVPTGFTLLDHGWQGGVRPGELAVVLTVTNLGKTQYLCYLAVSAYKANRRILLYTFELHPKQVLRRIVSGLLKKPQGSIDIEEAGQLLAGIKRRRGITEGYIEIRGGSMGVSDIAHDLDELVEEGRKPDVVLLDSGDDLIPQQTYPTLYLTQGEIYRHLRKLALQKEVAVWSSTQATREAIDKARISLRHMGDSFWKARRAHYVLGLSQSEADRADPFGAAMTMRILKDSEHGTPGQWANLRPLFGPSFAGKGYPGFEEVDMEASL